MAAGTQFMIHRCFGNVVANYDDLVALEEDFDRVDRAIAGDYVRKTGMDMDEILQMMSDETYLDPEGAMENGFCDAIHGDECEDDTGVSAKNKLLLNNRNKATTALGRRLRTAQLRRRK